MNIKEHENYLFKIVDKTLSYLGIELTPEEKADLVMMELLNIKQ